VIAYEWLTGLSEGEERELAELLALAAAEDRAPGFTSVFDPARPTDRHLLVRWLGDDRLRGVQSNPRLVSYLRLHQSPEARGVYVVHPEFRSRGVSMQLFEELGLDFDHPEGWCGTGIRQIRVWARGSHPAAARLASRLGHGRVRVLNTEWQFVRPLRRAVDLEELSDIRIIDSRHPGPLATGCEQCQRCAARPSVTMHVVGDDASPSGIAWVGVGADETSEWGSAGRILHVHVSDTHSCDIRPTLLASCMRQLRDAGHGAALVSVNASDASMVRVCRLLGFLHDRTDTEYQAGSLSSQSF
jgi:mycothiol synthase